MHACEFDCNIPQPEKAADPGLVSAVEQEAAVVAGGGGVGDGTMVAEAVNEQVSGSSAAVPESNSLNSSSVPTVYLIHTILFVLTSLLLP